MTVAQLIEALQEYPPELFVCAEVEKAHIPVLCVFKDSDLPTLTLELDADDVQSFLSDYLESYLENA